MINVLILYFCGYQICRRALAKAIAEGYDTVIVDTAVSMRIFISKDMEVFVILLQGRQVVDQKLMAELQQIKAALTPDETLLVGAY